MTRSRGPKERVYLLDGNVLVALVNSTHIHHRPAQTWFADSDEPFATCPITQGTLLRVLMRLGEVTSDTALAVLAGVTAHGRHRFWPDSLGYADISWRGVLGHREVTDAYLASLARHHSGRLVSFDTGLVALHADVALGLQ
ncbi:MAG: TA system VapC family ribonuclease toxin [Rubrivivax sp.]